jgi:hypothetical protein
MAVNVVALLGGFAGTGLIAPMIPWNPSSQVGQLAKGVAAATVVYTASGIAKVPTAQRKLVLYGAAFRLALGALETFAPALAARLGLASGIAKQVGLSGYYDEESSGFEGNIGGGFLDTQQLMRLQGHMAVSNLQ